MCVAKSRLELECYPTGMYYELGVEAPPEGPPKLHLLIESNEEYSVRTCTESFLYSLFQVYYTLGEAGR